MLQRLKKIISALTVTAMIFGIMPIGAFAENLNKADTLSKITLTKSSTLFAICKPPYVLFYALFL